MPYRIRAQAPTYVAKVLLEFQEGGAEKRGS